MQYLKRTSILQALSSYARDMNLHHIVQLTHMKHVSMPI